MASEPKVGSIEEGCVFFFGTISGVRLFEEGSGLLGLDHHHGVVDTKGRTN